MKFKDFLEEQKEHHAVLAFGRMNPITSGHEKLISTVKNIAKKHDASHHVVLSHTQDKAKNPLSADQKLRHARNAFPGTNFSASSKEHPNFLKQAQKLYHSGVTHLHMVGGSDRVQEFKDTLHKYNGTHEGALFNFKNIEVHSAGARDPDAEGISGMSASKMRGHAKTGNFREFKKGVPSSMSHEHAKALYNDVRKGMGLQEDINFDFEQLLNEGVHDQSIFKAVFLAGGPGSGKDYVLDNSLQGHGLVEINSDKALEYLMDKEGLDKKMPATEKGRRDLVRSRAKSMTELRQRLALYGRNGLIINGTGDETDKIKKIKERLEKLGYETSMVMVNTADDVSMQRNIERGQKGGRTVPEEVRKQKWQASQNSRVEYAKMFGDGYMEFDNSEDLRTASPDVVKEKKDQLDAIFKQIQKFVSKPPKTEQSKEWIASELERKDLLKVGGVSEKQPHSSSGAAEEAKKMGLEYYGFGRYGKGGKVTYRSVHDRLQPVQVMKEELDTEVQQLLGEAVSVTITGDSAEEVGEMISKLSLAQSTKKEESTFSDDTAKKLLSLGFKEMINQNEEKQDVKIFEGLICEQSSSTKRETPSRRPNQSSRGKTAYGFNRTQSYCGEESSTEETSTKQASTINEEDTRCEQGSRKKITISEIWKRKKEQTQESIDRGIEPGISMAGAGESIARDMGEVIGKDGKATPITLDKFKSKRKTK